MCTVTLRCGAGSLLLTMNRDERFDRAPEEPPRLISGDASRPSWLAPFDSASGGTWIGVNQRGVASCVLNGYEPADEGLRTDPSVPSRGSIIPRILEEQDGVGPALLPGALDFSAYPSFTLLVASPDGGEIALQVVLERGLATLFQNDRTPGTYGWNGWRPTRDAAQQGGAEPAELLMLHEPGFPARACPALFQGRPQGAEADYDFIF